MRGASLSRLLLLRPTSPLVGPRDFQLIVNKDLNIHIDVYINDDDDVVSTSTKLKCFKVEKRPCFCFLRDIPKSRVLVSLQLVIVFRVDGKMEGIVCNKFFFLFCFFCVSAVTYRSLIYLFIVKWPFWVPPGENVGLF